MFFELGVRGLGLRCCVILCSLLSKLSPEVSCSYLQKLLQPTRQTTLIVGAGIGGLSTAYYLGKETALSSRDHRIIVIDALEVFGAASSHNSGILSFEWLPDDVKPFGEYAYRLYETLAKENIDFREKSGYQSNVSFAVRFGNGPSIHELPAWTRVPNGWHAEVDPITGSAIVNPIGLGQWLFQECQKLGIEIHSHTTITGVDLSELGKLEHIWLSPGGRVSCSNLVLAAGAWTPGLFHRLFPASSIDFCETINSGNWIIVESPRVGLKNSTGQVILDDIVNHQLEFVSRNDGTVWISGLNNTRTPIDDVHNPIKPDLDAIETLREYANKFLASSPANQSGDIKTIKSGRTYRPTIGRDFPIITKVAPRMLMSPVGISDFQDSCRSSYGSGGVFVNTGQGKFGISMGLGSGKFMSQLILGIKPDIDVLELALTG